MAGDGSSVSGLAGREIMRRYARIEDAKAAIARGDSLFLEGDYEGALASYKAALSAIPDAPYTQEWLEYARLKYADCAVVVAKERAKNGRYEEARQLLNEALGYFPNHKGARLLLKELDDPDRWPPALTSQHVENVGKVEKGLLLGHSAVEIGNYDQGIANFQDVLRVDPYNSAARRGMENAERKRMQYFKTAYDHQRAKLLAQVDEMWEDKVPSALPQQQVATTTNRSQSGYLTEKMDKIIFPTVQFQNATVDEAIEYLRLKSKDLDVFETDTTRKGVNIIIRTGETPGGASISLDLRNVPMSEALRYICDLAQMKYKVEAYAVVVVPLSDNNTEMFNRTYRVPPDFLNAGAAGGGAAAPVAAADPFAAPGGAAGGSGLAAKPTAKDVLSAQGITFPDGASASYTASTSTLVVRNTQPNLDLIESYVEELNKQGPKQVVITSKFVEVTQKNTEELGFDWILGGVGMNGNNVFAGGGSSGNGVPLSSANFPFGNSATIPPISITQSGNTSEVFPAQNVASVLGGPVPLGVPPTSPGGGGLMTAGLRSGGYALNNNSIDNLLSTGTALGTTSVAPGLLSVAGVFSDPQFQMVMRGLSQKKGVDLMSAPSVTTKGGTRATMEVTREFIYPTEFDPPQLPQGNSSGGGGLLGGGGTTLIATPTTPTAFEMRGTGVKLEAEPTVGPDGNAIELNLSPEVVEFDGFINYGSPIYSPSSFAYLRVEIPVTTTEFNYGTAYVPLSQPERLITPNVINQPIFSVRKVTTGVTVWDGQTVALGGLIREDVQDVEDKLPILGDLPFVGRLFRSESEQHYKRNLMIFVTANLIDPSGQRIKPQTQSTAPAVGASLLLPSVSPP
ncbi:MAG: tetratricopeptide repeat protein [Verrucomicrobiaceae bacterium]|nr:tetratricopeptide repeat protein [Verrucomicrobiaceae bacterium]